MRDIEIVELKAPTMLPQLALIPGSLSEMLATVADTKVLTIADRYGLMAATLDDSLKEEDRRCVNRILRSVLRGRVKIVDQLSAVT